MRKYENIVFKQACGHDLALDIYVPEDTKNPPLIMWIHGGGWKDLNRTWNLVMPQLQNGYAVATVDYRYSDEDVFPGQMYDLKDALYYLRTHAEEYGYDGSKIIAAGDSAGGHLATMVGVSIGNTSWESVKGGDYSVQAVLDFCGAILFDETKDDDCYELLIGAKMGTKEYTAKAALAKPVNYIDGTEPPFLILHGEADPVVKVEAPRTLRNALEAAGDKVHMYYVPGGHHGMAGPLVDAIIKEFLDYYIKGIKTVITPQLTPGNDRTVPKTERYRG